jgi:hypothetical protein
MAALPRGTRLWLNRQVRLTFTGTIMRGKPVFRLMTICVAVLPGLLIPVSRSADAPQHRIVPLRPLSQDFAVIHGNPDVPGEPFVMRIRELPGTIIPPHKHPVDEHLTVVQGTLYFAVSDTFNRAALQEMKTGDYAFIPKGSTMFGFIPEGAVVQVHGIGPFHIHWRAGSEWRDKDQTLDDAGSAAVFKFRKGDRVIGSRGTGRIRQGYFSGEILQYEVEAEDGALFMANEDELRRP